MPNPVVAAIAGTPASSWVDAPVSRAASESDAVRFSNLLGAPPPLVDAPADVPEVDLPPVEGKRGMGDAILDSMQAVGRDYADNWRRVQGAMRSDLSGLSSTELVHMQLDLAEVAMHADIISKGISKAVQEVDQLTKLQ
jgi:hypothetical protein